MLVQASRVLFRQILLQRLGLLPYGVQYASLAPDPAFIPCAENSIEETMRDLLRRQRPVQLIFFCMAPPKHSCDTPTCSERKRVSEPIRRATTWSMEGPPGPRPEKRVHVISPLIAVEWPSNAVLTMAELSSPLTT